MIATFDHGPIRELRLNRPPVNALSPELIASLLEAIRTAPREGKRALLLSGSPGMFSAGLDVPLLLNLDRLAMDTLWREFYALFGALACSPIPIAAAITGHAPAGGTVLALFCDHRIAAEGDWKIGLSEVQVGLPVPPVILAALRRLVGPRYAERLAVRGLLISPAEAAACGLVDELAPADQVVDRRAQVVRGLACASPDGNGDYSPASPRRSRRGVCTRDRRGAWRGHQVVVERGNAKGASSDGGATRYEEEISRRLVGNGPIFG